MHTRATGRAKRGAIVLDWRVKPRWMLNLGLRYEYASPIREIHNLYGNFDPNSQYGIVQQGQPSVGNTLWKPNPADFSPRVGFAWDVTGKGTTVVRALSAARLIWANPSSGPPTSIGMALFFRRAGSLAQSTHSAASWRWILI